MISSRLLDAWTINPKDDGSSRIWLQDRLRTRAEKGGCLGRGFGSTAPAWMECLQSCPIQTFALISRSRPANVCLSSVSPFLLSHESRWMRSYSGQSGGARQLNFLLFSLSPALLSLLLFSPLLSSSSLDLSSSHFWSFDNLRWLHFLQCISHSVGNNTVDQQEDPLSYNGQALTTGLIPASSPQ